MLCFALAIVLNTPVTPRSSEDATALQRLHGLMAHSSDKKAWFVRFERELPASNIPTWQRLQKRVKPNNRTYVETAFALAYYGVDYDANLRRVQRPYLVWLADADGRTADRYGKEYPNDSLADNNLNSWGGTSFALNLLYLKQHDLKSLGAWLDLKLDGAPSEENDDSLMELWQRHSLDMLHAAYGHPRRVETLAEMLWYNHDEHDPQYIAALRNRLARLQKAGDGRAAQVLRQAIRGMEKIERQSKS